MNYIFHGVIALIWLHWKIKYQYNSHLFASVPRITMNFMVSNAETISNCIACVYSIIGMTTSDVTSPNSKHS